jgi:hypothetical protein
MSKEGMAAMLVTGAQVTARKRCAGRTDSLRPPGATGIAAQDERLRDPISRDDQLADAALKEMVRRFARFRRHAETVARVPENTEET